MCRSFYFWPWIFHELIKSCRKVTESKHCKISFSDFTCKLEYILWKNYKKWTKTSNNIKVFVNCINLLTKEFCRNQNPTRRLDARAQNWNPINGSVNLWYFFRNIEIESFDLSILFMGLRNREVSTHLCSRVIRRECVWTSRLIMWLKGNLWCAIIS